MCTLIAGRDILGPGTLIVAANRDEDSARPSSAPDVLSRSPRVVGGRDRVAGGTWLAIREGFAAVALMNRRPPVATATATRAAGAAPRSRGLLALEVASIPADGPEAFGEAALAHAQRLVAAERYAPFSLVVLTARGAWVLASDGGAARVTEIRPGWHVLTHADLDDTGEPRTARLVRELYGWGPATVEAARLGLAARLSEHAGEAGPAVCIHEGRMVTVSASIVYFGADSPGYWHAEGRPCEHAFGDLTELLGEPRSGGNGG